MSAYNGVCGITISSQHTHGTHTHGHAVLTPKRPK